MKIRTAAKLVSQKCVFERYYTLDVIEAEPKSLKHEGYATLIEREIMRVGHYSVVLLYSPETDEILLNQQFRMGPFIAGDEDPFLFECAMGGIDDGETPADAARREALEEAGCIVGELEHITSCYTCPGTIEDQAHIFVGRVKNPAAGLHGLDHEGEEIKTHLFPAKEVIAMADKNIIRNAITLLTVNWFARHHDRLRAQWMGNK